MATVSRLAVILHADVVGSTALVHIDERIAHDRIQAAFRRAARTISEYGGTTHEIRGDALVAEFARASDAVSAALGIQAWNEEQNASLLDGIRPMLRMGISLGEVVVADETLTGPGVILAQRVEQLANAGGLMVTEAIREAVPDRLPFDYERHDGQTLKGFEDLVHVSSVRLRTGSELPAPGNPIRGETQPGGWRRYKHAWAVGAVSLVLLLGGLLAWTHWWSVVPPRSGEPSFTERSGKPSVAVLPFENRSGSAEQEFFADGLTDDLITDLSKVSGLFVVSRNSVFTFKGQSVPADEVARTLGIRYVLKGTVRRADNRVRVNAQLVDGDTGRHLWAERYDRQMTDIFRVQDELVREIVNALSVTLTPAEQTRLSRKPTRNLQAYDLYLRARDGHLSGNPARFRESLDLFRHATELDPEFAEAWAGYARLAVDVWRFDYLIVMSTVLARKVAEEAANRALELNPTISPPYSVLALIRMVDGRHDFAEELAQRAVDLAPNSADAYIALAWVLGYAGEPERALEAIQIALHLNPRPPANLQTTHGWVLFLNRRYEAAINVLQPIVAGNRDEMLSGDSASEVLAMAYAQVGRLEEARAQVNAARSQAFHLSIDYYRLLYSHHRRPSDLQHRLEALRKAGIPDSVETHTKAADRLNEGEIQTLIAAGRSWNGKDVARALPFVQEFQRYGGVVYAAATTLIQGTATVRDGKLCERYEMITFGREACGYVYRNTNGSSAGEDEYLYVNPITARYFSLVR